jgi:ribonuclease Z
VKFQLTILGCGSAAPTTRFNPSAQVLNINENLFLIDCGEGTQMQMRKFKIHFQKIDHIFISHLHGDHFFGLMGYLSTQHLLGRTRELNLYAPAAIEQIIHVQLKASETYLRYPLKIIALTSKESEIILDNKIVTVNTIPLKHRIYCNGFLFKEKPRARNIIKQKIKDFNIPIYKINAIKNGEDFTLENGTVIYNSELTKAPSPARSYAYCSDTAYFEKIIKIIENVNLLYHESTFIDSDKTRAKETMHSTAFQAAEIAKKANANKLLLGHFSARYHEFQIFLDEAKAVFENTELCSDGACFEVE